MSVGELMERDEERPAYVRFETKAIHDVAASLAAGHYVSKDEDWVFVTPAYSKDCIRRPAEKWLAQKEIDVKKRRLPEKHLDFWKRAYENFKSGREVPIDGTSVKDWNALSPAQCQNLINAGCRTIEDMANANDEALRRIGMGAVDLKNKARAWKQAAKDHGPLVEQVTSLQNENAQLQGSISSLQEQITLLSRQLDAKERPNEVANAPDIQPTERISADDILEKTPAEQYEEKFGKAPHHRMKDETILQKLKE